MRNNRRPSLVRIHVLFSVLILAGCAFNRPEPPLPPLAVNQQVLMLNKTVCLLPFENNSGYEPSCSSREMTALLLDRFRKHHPNSGLIKSVEPVAPIHDSERITALVLKSRDEGASAIVSIELVFLNIEKTSSGFWWFKKTRCELSVQAKIGVIDPLTAAKRFDDLVKTKTLVADQTYSDFLQNRNAPIDEIDAIFFEFISRIAQAVDQRLRQTPWASFITDEHEGMFVVASGSTSGIQAGMLFDVYSKGDRVEGYDGRDFFTPGEKIGVIRISSVSAEQATSIPVSGEPPYPGCSIHVYDPDSEVQATRSIF